MSTEHDTETTPASRTEQDETATSATQPGPALLEKRTLTGIFVHLLGVGTLFVLPGLVYLVSNHDFTRENARNAVDWQVFYAASVVAFFALFGAVALADSLLAGVLAPEVVAGWSLLLTVGVVALGAMLLLNVVFASVATVKAVFGDTWEYPLAPDIVDRLRSQHTGDSRWWGWVGMYALVAPLTFVYLAWVVLGGYIEQGWAFLSSFALVVLLVLASVLTVAALFRDAKHLGETDAAWQPSWVPYLGVPFGVAVLTSLLSASLRNSENPAGDGVYGFMFVLWVASVAYLFRRHRHAGTS